MCDYLYHESFRFPNPPSFTLNEETIAMKIYQQSYTITASDMDITYHITPNAIMLYFQDCFARFLTSKHLAAFDLIHDHLIWVITDFDLKFVSDRPLWSTDIQVQIRFNEISALRIYVDYWICDASGAPFAEGSSVWVILDSQTKRPISAKAMLEAGGIEATDKGTPCGTHADTSAKALLKEVEHNVNVTDLDFNGHVCNRSYLILSLSTLPVEFIQTYSPRYFHIKFARESFFGDTLTCKISKGQPMQYWFDIVNQHGKAICHIYSEWEDKHELLSRDVSEMIPR